MGATTNKLQVHGFHEKSGYLSSFCVRMFLGALLHHGRLSKDKGILLWNATYALSGLKGEEHYIYMTFHIL